MNSNNFLEFFDYLVSNCKEQVVIPEEVQEFYDMLKSQEESQEKSLLTESGLEILEYLQSVDAKSLKAKDIADGMGVSSRKINGAIRKLTADKFVDKFGKNPVIYSLTQQGKDFDIAKYKENLNKKKGDN